MAVALAIFVAYALLEPPVQVFTGPLWAVWAVALGTALPVAVRRRWPLPVLAVAGVGTVAATLAGVVGAGVMWVAYTPVALALYVVSAVEPPLRSAAALVACLLASAAAVVCFYATFQPVPSPEGAPSEVPLAWPVEAGAIWGVTGGAWAAGTIRRWRRAAAAELARRAAAEERLRIARELHDIVGHSMSLIAVKSTVANHIAGTDPEEALSALAVIEHTSRVALTDIRRLLGVLRADPEDGAETGTRIGVGSGAETGMASGVGTGTGSGMEIGARTGGETGREAGPVSRAALAPAPGLAQLYELAEHTRAAGASVELEVRGVGDLPEAVGLSVYRIVQEALTNVVKHAVPARCRVDVEADGRAVRIEVVDEGRGRGSAQSRGAGAHGLIGMRERVAMFGGTFSAGPRAEGGFRVSARLPYESSGRTR